MHKTQRWKTSYKKPYIPKIHYYKQAHLPKKRNWRNNSLISFRMQKNKTEQSVVFRKKPEFTPNITRIYYKPFKVKK